jgi:predicted component of type VI protein secretion system
MCISDLNIEFEELGPESVESAQAAAASSHKEWLDITSVDVSVQKNLSNLFSSGRVLKEKLESEKQLKVKEACKAYYNQGEPRKSDHQTDLIQVCQI